MSNVNKLVLGTVQFGTNYGINNFNGQVQADEVTKILSLAHQSGIEKLDTSSAYGNSEEVLGQTLSQPMKIISKYPQSALSVKECLQYSLKKLQTDHLYGYMLHGFNVYAENPLVWNEMQEVREEGKVDKIGISIYMPDELDIILQDKLDIQLLQIPRNIFDVKFDKYLLRLKDMGVEIHVRSTFLQGLFFMDRDKLPEKLKPMRPYLLQLDQYASEYGVSISQLALNHNLANPFIEGVLIGVDNASQLEANLYAAKKSTTLYNTHIQVKEQYLLNPSNWK